MATGVASWSQTAASNATADSTINFAEGMAPSAVNDSARALMASVAKWRDDVSGSLTTAGTSTAYTLTTNQGFASLAALTGQILRFKLHTTCGASPTLSVDGLTAQPLSLGPNAPIAGDLQANTHYTVAFDGSTFWLSGYTANPIPSGTVMLFQQTAAPTGWTKSTTHNDKALRVVSGTASSGGSTAFSSIMAARTIAQANLPNYSLTVSNTLGISNTLALNDPGHFHSTRDPGAFLAQASAPGEGPVNSWDSSTLVFTDTRTTGITLTGSVSLTGSVGVTSGGSGTALDFAVQYVDIILATKN